MKRLLILIFILGLSCKSETSKVETSKVENNAERTADVINQKKYSFKIYDYDGLEPLINKKDDLVHVVNFWATWCAPCVKELPYFEEINDNYKKKGVEVLLVSLDFPKQYETKLQPFIDKHNLQSEVVAFDDINQNRWIPAIYKDWSGAIPATLIYKGEKRKFYEKSFTKEELETEITEFLK